MDNFLIYEEIQKRDACIVYRGRIKRSIDFVMIYCVDKYKRHELSNLVRLMYELDNPNIMKFREWYETTNHLWLVMDLCDGEIIVCLVVILYFHSSFRWFIEINHSSRRFIA